MKPSRWAKPATMARPAKADPDVIRLQNRYLLTYGRARLLKAFSYGLALRHDLLAYLLGDDGAPIRCMGDAFEGIRRRVPRFRPRAIGHTDAIYVLEDQALIAEIRAAMEGKPDECVFRSPSQPIRIAVTGSGRWHQCAAGRD